MKKIIFSSICLFIVIAIASCNSNNSEKNNDLKDSTGKSTSKPSDVVVSKEKSVESFSKIKIDGVFNVVLHQTGEDKVVIEADEHIQPLITTKVNDGVLEISMKDSMMVRKMKKIEVNVYLSEINEISSTGVGKITNEKILNCRQLKLNIRGVGATQLNIIAAKLDVESEVLGVLDLKGSVDEAIIHHSGIGAIKAFELVTNKLSLLSEGIGAAEVNAKEELKINVKGLGGVRYKGDPKVKQIKKEGLGRVEAVK